MYVALDFETTGRNPHKCLPIQVAVAVPLGHNRLVFEEWDISHSIEKVGFPEVEKEALEINGFTLDRIFFQGTPTHQVDMGLRRWLEEVRGGNAEEELIPLGWNVGKFDVRLMERFLPQSFELMSYRTRELNSAVAIVAEIAGDIEYDTLKEDVKRWSEFEANRHLPGREFHDALFDCVAAIHAWDYLISYGKGQVLSV